MALFAFVVLTLGLLFLQIYHFRHRDLRLDEVLTAHAGLVLAPSQITLWRAGDIHPPMWTLLGAAWASLVGLDAGLLRFQSTLYSALMLAGLYRLGVALFRPRVSLLAMFIVGTWAVFHFYTHEFRPYAMLAMWSVACQFAFLLWLRRPCFGSALAFVVSGIAVIYTHYFGLYVILALALVFVVFVRWSGPYYLRTFGLFIAIGLAYTPWLLPFIHSFMVTRPGGIEYASGSDVASLRDLVREFAPQPVLLAGALLVAAPLIPVVVRQRNSLPRFYAIWGQGRWRVAYPLCIAVLVLGLAIVAHQVVESLTLRNLTLIMPTLALLMAYTVNRLPLIVRVLAVAMLVLPGITTFVEYERTLPLKAMAAFVDETYQADAPIIFNTGRGPSTNVGVAYNLEDRIASADRLRFVHLNPITTEIAPDPLPNEIIGDSADDEARFLLLVGSPEQFWYVHAPGADVRGLRFLALLGDDYEAVRSSAWNQDGMLRIVVTEYRRRD